MPRSSNTGGQFVEDLHGSLTRGDKGGDMRRIVRFLTVVCAMALGALPLAVSGGSAQAALTVPATVSASNWTTMSNTEGTSPSSDSYLGSLSCVTSVFCLAVGSNDVFSDPTYFAEQWNGSTWSPIALPTPAGAAELELDQVSCVTTSFCVAVGQAYFSGTQTPLILQWNGSGFVVVLGGRRQPALPPLSAPSRASTHRSAMPPVRPALTWTRHWLNSGTGRAGAPPRPSLPRPESQRSRSLACHAAAPLRAWSSGRRRAGAPR